MKQNLPICRDAVGLFYNSNLQDWYSVGKILQFKNDSYLIGILDTVLLYLFLLKIVTKRVDQTHVFSAFLQLLGRTSAGRSVNCTIPVGCASALEILLASGVCLPKLWTPSEGLG